MLDDANVILCLLVVMLMVMMKSGEDDLSYFFHPTSGLPSPLLFILSTLFDVMTTDHSQNVEAWQGRAFCPPEKEESASQLTMHRGMMTQLSVGDLDTERVETSISGVFVWLVYFISTFFFIRTLMLQTRERQRKTQKSG